MFGALSEFSYLTAPKAELYRRVMRFFYEQHLAQRGALPPEDVAAAVGGAGYTLDACLLDLEQLLAWGNLGKRRDPRRVASLAEYARRRDLYYATNRALAIEGFLETGLDAAEDAVTVGVGVVANIEARVQALEVLLDEAGADQAADAEEIETLWYELNRDFLALSGDARNLAVNLERRLSLEDLGDFLDFKDAVRAYVERLARELAGPGRRVRGRLAEWGAARRERFILTAARARSGRLTVGANLVDASRARATLAREFAAFEGWFSRPAREGDGLEYAVEALRGAVARVLAYVDAVHRTRELGLGRAGALADLARELEGEEDPARARELLSAQLHLFAGLHAGGDVPPEPAADPWREPIETVTLTPVVRGKLAATPSASVGRTSPEARAAAREALRKHRERQKALLALFKNAGGELHLADLELPDVEMLRDVLSWLDAGSLGPAAGPEGRLIEVQPTDDPAQVRGADWHLWLERGATLRLLGEAE